MDNKKSVNNFYKYLIGVIIVIALFTLVTRERTGARCWDGTNSSATGRGACSHHGGVMYWEHDYWWD